MHTLPDEIASDAENGDAACSAGPAARSMTTDQAQGRMSGKTQLDRSKWHSPLVSVIVTHYNYSDHIEEALLSVLDQSHRNWECIVVDDASTPEHTGKLQEIAATLQCPRIRVIENPENVGQVRSFYVGLDNSRGDFVALLDPDDRYGEAFLKETVDAHLDDTFYCPVVCTDQYMLTERGITTGTFRGDLYVRLKKKNLDAVVKDAPSGGIERIFFPPETAGCFWSSTSAMVFRRSALKYLRPHRLLAYRRAVDAYLASGAHIVGGTLFVSKPLVYRGLHSRNSWITEDLFSMRQSQQRSGTQSPTPAMCRRDAMEVMLHNGIRDIFDDGYLCKMLRQHFTKDDLALLCAASAQVAELVSAKTRRRSFISRLGRSLRKRGIRPWALVAGRPRPAP